MSSIDSSTPIATSSRLDALASELVGQKVEVILVGNAAKRRARAAGDEDDTHRHGGRRERRGHRACRKSGQAGGNITGFTSQQDEVLGKLIGILHEVAPGARRIAILLNENNPLHAVYWAAPRALAPRWTSLRCVLSPARPRNSAPPSSRSFDNDHRPSW